MKRTFFHRTTRGAAAVILRQGFVDSEGFYGFGLPVRGVWLSAVPLTENEGAEGDCLLGVKINPVRIKRHEVIEPGKPYREYLVPTALLNRAAKVYVVPPSTEERIERQLWRRHRTSRLPLGWRSAGGHVATYQGAPIQRD